MKNHSFSRFQTSLFWCLGLLGSVPSLFPLSGLLTVLAVPQPAFSRNFSVAPKSTQASSHRRAAHSATVTFQIQNPTECSWEQMLLRSLKQIFGIDETQAQRLQPEFRWTFHDKTPLAQAGPFQIQMEASIYRLYLSKLGLVSENSSNEESTQDIKEAAKALFSERTGTPHSPHSSPDLLAVLEQEVSTAKSQLDQLPKELVQELADLLPPAPSSQGQSPTPSEPAPSLPSKPGSSSPQTPLADPMSPLPMPAPLSLTQRYPAHSWPQLRRILDKVRSLTPEERRLYRSLFSKTISDLQQMEQGLDAFLSLKQKLNASSVSSAHSQQTSQASPPSSLQLSSSVSSQTGSTPGAHTASPSGSASGVGSVSPPSSFDSSQSGSSGSASLGEMDGISLDDLQATAEEKQQLLALQKHIFSQFDPKSLPLLTPSQRKDLARSLSQQQTKAQLLHMAKHPLQTLNHMAESLLDTTAYSAHMERAFTEMQTPGFSFVHKLSSGFHMGSTVTGQAGSWFLLGALVFSPVLAPSLVVAAGTAAFGLLLTSLVLSSVESELRLEAAAQTTTPSVFVQNTVAASEAQVTATSASLLLLLMEGGRVFFQFPRVELFTKQLKVRLKQGIQQGMKQADFWLWKNTHLPTLRTSYSQAIKALFSKRKQTLQQEQQALASIQTGEALLQKVIQGDHTLQTMTHLSPEQAQKWLSWLPLPKGAALVEGLLTEVKQLLAQKAKMLATLEEQTLVTLEHKLTALETAKTAAKAQEALTALEQTFSETGLVKQLKEQLESVATEYLKNQAATFDTNTQTNPSLESLPSSESIEPNPLIPSEEEVHTAQLLLEPSLLHQLEETFTKLKLHSKSFKRFSFQEFLSYNYRTWKKSTPESPSSFSEYLASINQGLQEMIQIWEESTAINQNNRQIPKIAADENIGIAHIEIQGWVEEVMAVSRQDLTQFPKMIRNRKVLDPKDFPGDPYFEAEAVGNQSNKRETDSEYRIFEYVARTLKHKWGEQATQASGNITLFSERYFCDACQGLIEKFQKQFPRIQVTSHSGPEVPKGGKNP